MLQTYFDKYIDPTLIHLRKHFSYIVPVAEISTIISLCKLLQSILDKHQEVKSLEMIFVFSCVWAIGAGFSEKDGKEYKKDFSSWWRDTFKTVKFQNKGTVFDFFVNNETGQFEEWSNMHTKDVVKDIDTSRSISNYTIPTSDTISAQFLMKQFISTEHACLLVGKAGCGKT